MSALLGLTFVVPAALAAQSNRPRAMLARYSMVARGSRTIPAGTVSRGSVLVINGNLDIYGDVAGAATAVGGDIIVHPGGRVRGAAVAFFGSVRNEGGSILGVIKNVGRNGVDTRLSYGRPPSTFRSLRSAIAWLVALLLLGTALLFSAGDYLKRVVQTVSNQSGRSLLFGVIGGISTVPLLIALVIAMAITIVGIFLIPLGVVGFFVVVSAMALLGFIAVAQVTGIAISGESTATETPAGKELRYLVSGILAFSALWIIAAVFTWFPVVGTVLRVLAASITFVAAATGFGAVIIASRQLWKERKAAAA